MVNKNQLASVTERTLSRRANPRIEVLGHLQASIVALDVPVVVANLGAGGFSVECAISFPPGTTHQFRFTTTSGVAFLMNATSKHSRPVTLHDGTDGYISGFGFVLDGDDDVEGNIDLLLEEAISVISFK